MTPRLPPGLDPDAYAIVRDALARWAPGRRAVVFGSRATGRHRPLSDLDLLILGAPLPAGDRGALVDELLESDLPYRVDLVEAASTGEAFVHRALGEGFELPLPVG